MDDRVGGIYLHASEDGSTTSHYVSSSENNCASTVPEKVTTTSTKLTVRDVGLPATSSCAEKSTSYHLLNGKDPLSNGIQGPTVQVDGAAETSVLRSCAEDVMSSESIDVACTYGGTESFAGPSFLESDVSLALTALVEGDDEQTNGEGNADAGEEGNTRRQEVELLQFSENSANVNHQQDVEMTDDFSNGLMVNSIAETRQVPIAPNVVVEVNVNQPMGGPRPTSVTSEHQLMPADDDNSLGHNTESINEPETVGSSPLQPSNAPTDQAVSENRTKDQQKRLENDSSPSNRNSHLQTVSSSAPDQIKRHIQANYHALFDPSSKRSLKQRQKIHNIVDRLRTGAHTEGLVTNSGTQVTSAAQTQASPPRPQGTIHQTNNISHASPQSGSYSLSQSGQGTKTLGYMPKDATRPRQDPAEGPVKSSLHAQTVMKIPMSKHASPGGEVASHAQGVGRPYAASVDSNVQVVNRIPVDNSSRRNEFPQVMIQDVFSQSTGKRLTQRNQPVSAVYPNSGSPLNTNQHGMTVVSSAPGPQIVATGSVMSGQHVQHELHPNGLSTHEEPIGQHYARPSVQLPNHQVQPDGTIAHQHHPKANISHFERPGQGVVRQYGQWAYSPMHNPISNLQLFVNQPNPSSRQQTGNVVKHPNHAVVDLSSVQYGSSNSPITHHPSSSDQPGEKEQNLPRLQPVNTPQASSQISGTARATAHPNSRYIGPYASGNSAPYNRHVQPHRQYQAVRQSPGNSNQHQITQVYQVGSVNSRDRSAGGTAVVTMANKGMQYIPSSNSVQVAECAQYPGYGDYDKVQQPQDALKHLQNVQLPMPLPNFGGFLSTKGLENPLYDSLSGYLILPIKKLKDSSCQTDEKWGEEGGQRLRSEPQKTSVGCQAQTGTYLCGSCLTEMEVEDGVQERVVNTIDLTCKVCNQEFASIGKLQNHKSKAHNMRLPFRCGECAIRFEDHASVVKHLASHNEDNSCSICGKAFQNKETLERHERLHKSPVTTCQFCTKQFKTPLLLRKHMKEFHRVNGDGLNSCYRPEVNNNVSAHSEEDELNDGNDDIMASPDKTPSRDANAVNRARLNSQENAADCGEHYCHFCQIEFATDKYLMNHYLSYHRKYYGFQCPVCPRYIHLWSRLKKHIKDHGLLPGNSGSQEEEKQGEEADMTQSGIAGIKPIKKFAPPNVNLHEVAKSLIQKTSDGRWKCLKCDENFYSEVRVKNHLGTAHEDRLYQCSICWLHFSHSTHLYWHMRDHKRKGDITEIPAKFVSQTQSVELDGDSLMQKQSFKCKHCGEDFYLERHLSSHLGKKHGYKVFSCQICGDKFNFSSRLVLHMKHHSSKQKAKLVARRQVTRSSVFRKNVNSTRNADAAPSLDDSDVIESDVDSNVERDEGEQDRDGNKTDDSSVKVANNSFQNGFVYLCGFCNEGFSEEADFRQHMLGHQRTKRTFKCRLCGQRFATQGEADKHLELHSQDHNTDFPSQEDISIEEGIEEDGMEEDDHDGTSDNLWTSAFVGEGTRSEKSIDSIPSSSGSVNSVNASARPLRSGQPAPEEAEEKVASKVACPICGREFKTKPGRRLHMKTTHRVSGMRHFAKMKQRMKRKTLTCPICEKPCKTEGGIRLHLQSTHRLSWQQITGMLKDAESAKVNKGRINSSNETPSSPPGLQKLIITKAKGQNTLVISTANGQASSKLPTDNEKDANVRSPPLSPIRIVDGSENLKSNSDFQCPFCDHISYTLKGMRSHITRLHQVDARAGNIWVLCEICNRNFYDQDQLAAHCVAAHKVKEDFKCPQCPAIYQKFSGMYTHIRRKHTALKWKMKGMWHRCAQCGRSFYDKTGLNAHARLVHPVSANSKILNRPRAAMTPKSPLSGEEGSPARGKTGSFHCPTCDIIVNTIKGMQVHILKRHPTVEIKKWQFWEGCPICGEFFFDEERLDKHTNDVHVSGQDSAKTRSIQREHSGLDKAVSKVIVSPKPSGNGESAGGFQCPLCEEFYPKFMGVDAHLRQTHNILERKRKPVWSVCLFCEQHYYTEEALKLHVEQTHAGEDPPANTTAEVDTSAHDGDVSGEISMDMTNQGSTTGFQCPKCEVIIPSIKGMQVHMYRGHQRLKRKRWQEWVMCEKCGLHVYDTKTLEAHMSRRHGTTSAESGQRIESPTVVKSSKGVGNRSIEDSPNTAATIDSGFMCPACPHVCPKYAGIDTHIRVKHGYKAVHGKKFWITCHLCGLHLYNERNMDDHILTAHGGNFRDDDTSAVVEGEESVTTADEEPRRLRGLRQINTSTPKVAENQAAAKVDDSIQDSPNGITSTPRSHVKSVVRQSGYECPYCANVYPKFLGVDAHIRQKHGPNKRKRFEGWMKCGDCGRLLCNDVYYEEHMKKHATEQGDLEESTQDQLVTSSILESSITESESSQVDGGFPVDMDFVRRGTFHCPECPVMTNYKGIGVHLSRSHRKFPRKRSQLWSPCPHCDNFFFNEVALQKHVQSVHETQEVEVDKSDTVNQQSDVAAASTAIENVADVSDDAGSVYEADTAGTSYHCPGCTKVSSLCRVINAHIARQHKLLPTKSTLEWIQCGACSSVFYDRACLEAHNKKEHITAQTNDVNISLSNMSGEDQVLLNGDNDVGVGVGVESTDVEHNVDTIISDESGLKTDDLSSQNVQSKPDSTTVNISEQSGDESLPAQEGDKETDPVTFKTPVSSNTSTGEPVKRKADGDGKEEDPKLKVSKIADDTAD